MDGVNDDRVMTFGLAETRYYLYSDIICMTYSPEDESILSSTDVQLSS